MCPVVVVGDGMAQDKLGRVLAGGRELERDEAGLGVAEPPGQLQSVRGLTCGDGAPGVALELKAPAGSQVAAQREKPAADALGVGAGVPDIADRRMKRAALFRAPTALSTSRPARYDISSEFTLRTCSGGRRVSLSPARRLSCVGNVRRRLLPDHS